MNEATPNLNAQAFTERWRNTRLSERQSYQAHFMDLCRLVGHETPKGDGKDAQGRWFTFEYGLKKETGGQGFADVYYEGHFAIEYKAPGKYKDLNEAYQQLLQYREKLKNPPLLVVTDIENWEVHTNWPNTEKRVYSFRHDDIATRANVQRWLHSLFSAPEQLHPRRNTEQVTADAAQGFQLIADNMRQWQANPDRIARFLTKLVFCLFAEDVALLPGVPGNEVGLFSMIVEQTKTEPARFIRYTQELFRAMADGGEVMFARVPYFNGSLFDDVLVEELSADALGQLAKATRLNWESVEPAIFGTLFERSLDPAKRAQLGAHYTGRDDILLIVEPVLMAPLHRQWEAIMGEAAPIRAAYDAALLGTNRREIKTLGDKLEALRERMLAQLRTVKVLDPACGSGNFLYVSLQLLMQMEKQVINHELFTGLTRPFPEVHPRQMYGIEINPIAHALASIVVWIGYIQWRKQNGYIDNREPILEDLSDNIRRMDAIMTLNADGTPREPDWPAVDVIVGNPPFLGGYRLRSELGNEYVDALFKRYEGRIPPPADFVTYWFEKARAHIAAGKAKRAGLLSTNSIRGGANREVLKRIKESGDIFMAWADREWVLDGAAVRVSMVGFDDKTEVTKTLNGQPAATINPDLTASVDITKAKRLSENANICLRGNEKHGPFDIPEELAQKMLRAENESGRSNADVLHPYINAYDVVRNPRKMWIIDFFEMSLEEAEKYELPIAHVRQFVKPIRDLNNRARRRENWWQHGEIIPNMRRAIDKLSRFVVTPAVAKHRIFVQMNHGLVPDHQLMVFAREDDYFFGVLHSKLHEVWSLRMGTWLGVGNDPRYTPTTTFETFPFPWPPGAEDLASPAHQAISAAAAQLHTERDAWLNPPGDRIPDLRERTLTNLYNALAVFRGQEKMKVRAAAGDFAPRLAELHDALDRAVCAAYGWDADILADEEAMLRALLALNLARADAAAPIS
jgi:type II restriction/modification system DNA methylase subunit YeeA